MCAACMANQRPATAIAESTGEALIGLAVAAATAPATRVFRSNTLVWVRALALSSNILGIPILSIVTFVAVLKLPLALVVVLLHVVLGLHHRGANRRQAMASTRAAQRLALLHRSSYELAGACDSFFVS